jgi:hypothetical protein
MRKLGASIAKELQLLAHDKVGLLLLYLMPVVLVFIITVVQDSAFKLVNDNQLELLVTNADEGNLGDSLVAIQKIREFHHRRKKQFDGEEITGRRVVRRKASQYLHSEKFF